MKTYLPLFSRILAVLTASLIVASGAVQAQQKKPDVKPKPSKKAEKLISFSELEKKLQFDKSSIASKDGFVVSYAPVLEKAMPAVVTIFSTKTVKASAKQNTQQEELFRRMFPDIPEGFFEKHNKEQGIPNQQQGLGSGVVIGEDGYIITNNHVVTGADEIVVSLSRDKIEYRAKIIGSDPKTDVALIKIEATGLETIVIGDSSKLRIGDIAFAIGNPHGLEQSATHGIVSALGRSDLGIIGDRFTGGGFENFIQTDASVNKGNSGGALIDAHGRLIGINTAIQSNYGGNIGIAFAIPSNMAMRTIQRLLDGHGTVHRGVLGVILKELTPDFARALDRKDRSGVVIREVIGGTPAEKYGMKAGDLIVSFNGKKTESFTKLRLDISNTDPGTKVNFDVIRNGALQKIDVVLGDLESVNGGRASSGGPKEKPSLPKPKELIEGVQISELDEKVREGLKLPSDFSGVLVKSVSDGSPAAEAGLRAGSVITQIDQRNVSSVKQAYDFAAKVSKDVIILQVFSNGSRDVLAILLK